MLKYIFTFFTIISFYSQEIKISGYVKSHNRSIENASVVVIDTNENTLAYAYSNEKGYYELHFKTTNTNNLHISCASLGFKKEIKNIELTKNDFNIDFILEEKIEALNEIVIQSDQKIKIDQDTTTIKVVSFINKTEQTVEDILKKIPGVEVLKDGTIKAHGKQIDKLLIEGEDVFNKDYKLLSKNLDAKVVEAVQIIDHFEDNPIFKKLSDSEKVALNLKLKKNKQNVWFGNITAGTGVVSENRWKEAINLGLLRKKIKLFYFADYNNLGDKATTQITNTINENNIFGEERIEKKAKKSFTIYNSENNEFNSSQNTFNNAFLNTLSCNTKFKPNLSLRSVLYYANDQQIQNSFSQTIYNFDATPIIFTENKDYHDDLKMSSAEIELKYHINEDNYMKNVFLYKSNPKKIFDLSNFNETQINQYLNNQNQTFYNHLNHTLSIGKQSVLNTYLYFGKDFITEKDNISSPILNDYLGVPDNETVVQEYKNSILYFGIKSKLISKYKKWEHIVGFGFEKDKEKIDSEIRDNSNFDNLTSLKQSVLNLDNTLKYTFSEKFKLFFSLNSVYNKFNHSSFSKEHYFLNPSLNVNISKTGFGNFTVGYSENSNLPTVENLNPNYSLSTYKSFTKGNTLEQSIKNSLFSLFYTFYNDEKRFSINSNFMYIRNKKTIGLENTITNDFTFSDYNITDGGENYNATFSLVNYFKPLNLATKIETNQSWNSLLIKVNSNEFTASKGHLSSYTFSGTTYFKIPVNFDFGIDLNFYNSKFNQITSSNKNSNAFVKTTYTVSKNWILESNNNFYFLNNNTYAFLNAIVNFNPKNSKFSYRLIGNNLLNERDYKIITLDNYTTTESNTALVPRYLLLTVRYRF